MVPTSQCSWKILQLRNTEPGFHAYFIAPPLLGGGLNALFLLFTTTLLGGRGGGGEGVLEVIQSGQDQPVMKKCMFNFQWILGKRSQRSQSKVKMDQVRISNLLAFEQFARKVDLYLLLIVHFSKSCEKELYPKEWRYFGKVRHIYSKRTQQHGQICMLQRARAKERSLS